MKPRRPSFAELNAAGLARFDAVMALLGLEGGKRQGPEYLPLNPRRADHKTGSFAVNTVSGAWSDFATGDRGGDLISLAAYVWAVKNGEAAARLGEMLGFATGEEPARPPREKGEKVNVDDSSTFTRDKPAGVWIHPIPADAPAPPAVHTRHGKPSKVWTYRDAAGLALFRHARFEAKTPEGRKEFCPQTLWRDAGGRLFWQWKAPPAPRPLYNLPALAAHAEAPAILGEGEKAADAAAGLFPDHPVLTWQGGAQAVSKADFRPLAGREVWIWPDADEAGAEAARKLSALLPELGAGPVRLLNLELLAQAAGIDAEGRPELAPGAPLEKGDDAADLLARGWTAGHMALLLENPAFLQGGNSADTQAPTPPEKSLGGDPGKPAAPARRFELLDRGVFLFESDREGNPKPPRWICGPLETLARVRNIEGAGWGLLVKFSDPDGAPHRVVIPANLFRGEGLEVAGLLLDHGLQIAPRGRPGLVEYLQTANPMHRARITNRIGWHGEPDRAAYVLPESVFGAASGEEWLYEPEGPRLNPFRARGTLAQWREGLARLCAGNSRLLFAVSLPFAAPLLHLAGAESGGFHLRGESSGGKSTLLRVAASVCGAPDFVRPWRATDNGLEGEALARCDAPLLLDELAQVEARIAGEAAYLLANGQAKSRAARAGGLRERASWRVLFLSAGEISLAQHMGEAGKAPRAGQETRLADIPADGGAGLGVFENLHGHPSGHEFARALNHAAARYHGTGFPAFLARLIDHRAELPELLQEGARRFEAQFLSGEAAGQARRVAGRFALVGLAGELARDWLALPWAPGEALAAAGRCFADWLEARTSGEGNAEEAAMLAQVRAFLSLHAENRFTDWDRPAADTDKHAPRTMNRAGFRRITFETSGRAPEDQETEFFIFPQVWKGEVCKGHDPRAVARLLIRLGFLIPADPEHAAKSLTLPGEGKRRVYHVLPTIWENEE